MSQDEAENSVEVYDEDEYDDEYEEDSASISSSPAIPDENIDFSLVYALHTFVATVEGQASVLKGDQLMLLDDTNSYWWLVRVLKTHAIGYIPAENIETPWERLARLNKHRNVDLSNPTERDVASGPQSAHVSERLFTKRIPPSKQPNPHASRHPTHKGVMADETHRDHPVNISPHKQRKRDEERLVEFTAPVYYDYSADEWPYGSDYDAEYFDSDESGDESTSDILDEGSHVSGTHIYSASDDGRGTPVSVDERMADAENSPEQLLSSVSVTRPRAASPSSAHSDVSAYQESDSSFGDVQLPGDHSPPHKRVSRGEEESLPDNERETGRPRFAQDESVRDTSVHGTSVRDASVHGTSALDTSVHGTSVRDTYDDTSARDTSAHETSLHRDGSMIEEKSVLGENLLHQTSSPVTARGNESPTESVSAFAHNASAESQGSPQLKEFPSVSLKDSPSFRHGSPSLPQGSPSVRQGSPSIRQGSPSIRQGSPSIRQGSPSLRQGSPSVRQGSPSLRQGSPSVRQGSPSVRQESSLRDSPRQVAASSPQLDSSPTRRGLLASRQRTSSKQATSDLFDGPTRRITTTPQIAQATKPKADEDKKKSSGFLNNLFKRSKKDKDKSVQEPDAAPAPSHQPAQPTTAYWHDEALRQQQIEAQSVLYNTYGVTRRHGHNTFEPRPEAERMSLQDDFEGPSLHSQSISSSTTPDSDLLMKTRGSTPIKGASLPTRTTSPPTRTPSPPTKTASPPNVAAPHTAALAQTPQKAARGGTPTPAQTFGSPQSPRNVSGSSLQSPGRTRPGSVLLSNGVDIPTLNVMRVFASDGLNVGSSSFKTVLLNESTSTTDLIKQAVQRFQLSGTPLSDYYLSVKQIAEDKDRILGPHEKPLIVFDALAAVFGASLSMDMPSVKRSSVSSISSLASMFPASGAGDFGDDSKVKFYLHVSPSSIPESVAPTTGHPTAGTLFRGGVPSFTDRSLAFAVKISIDKDSSRSGIMYISQGTTVSELTELVLAKYKIPGLVSGGDGAKVSPQAKQFTLHAAHASQEYLLNPRTRVLDAFRQAPPLHPMHAVSRWEMTPPEQRGATLDPADTRAADPMFVVRPARSTKTVDELDAVKRKRASLNSSLLVPKDSAWTISSALPNASGGTDVFFSTQAALCSIAKPNGAFAYWFTPTPSTAPIEVTHLIQAVVPSSHGSVDGLKHLCDNPTSATLTSLHTMLTHPDIAKSRQRQTTSLRSGATPLKKPTGAMAPVDIALECVSAQAEHEAAVRRRQRRFMADHKHVTRLPASGSILAAWNSVPDQVRRDAQFLDASVRQVDELFERTPLESLDIASVPAREWYASRTAQLDEIEAKIDSILGVCV